MIESLSSYTKYLFLLSHAIQLYALSVTECACCPSARSITTLFGYT